MRHLAFYPRFLITLREIFSVLLLLFFLSLSEELLSRSMTARTNLPQRYTEILRISAGVFSPSNERD